MKRSLLLPAASGLLLWAAFPPLGLFPVAWFALAPYLWFCATRRPWGQILIGHALFCVPFWAGVLYWIPGVLETYGGLPRPVSLLALGLVALLLGLVQLPAAVLIQWVGRRSVPHGILSAPGFWLLLELVRNIAPFGGFPWASLGYTQVPFSWVVQIADLGSVYLVSFVVVLINGLILATIRLKDPRFGLAAAAVLASVCLYGAYRVHLWSPAPEGVLAVAIAQADIALMAEQEHYATKYFRTLPRLFDQAVAEGARWVVFPEAQNPFQYEHDFYFRQFWEDRVRLAGVYLLFNSTSFGESDYFNSAHLLAPDGARTYRYDKMHLVPFGEYLPLRSLFGMTEALVAEVSHFAPGERLEVGKVDGIPFATLICYEAIFPEIAREGAAKGAQILVNITNDGWFGPTAAPEQHLQMTAVRAIETRKVCLRGANSGFSAIITPTGRVLYKTGLFEEALVTAEVEANSYRSPFVRFGFWPCHAVIMVTLAVSASAWRRPKGRRT